MSSSGVDTVTGSPSSRSTDCSQTIASGGPAMSVETTGPKVSVSPSSSHVPRTRLTPARPNTCPSPSNVSHGVARRGPAATSAPSSAVNRQVPARSTMSR